MVDPAYARLVATLCEIRRDLRITQSQIAAAIGVHPTTFRMWEWLRYEPKAKMRARWARALGYELGYTLTPIRRERRSIDGGG